MNPFTYRLAICPLVALDVVLSRTDGAGVRYWTPVLSIGCAMLVVVSMGAWAIELPRDVIGPYADPIWDYAAFALLDGLRRPARDVLLDDTVAPRSGVIYPRRSPEYREPVGAELQHGSGVALGGTQSWLQCNFV